jgi:hypothetical protein
MIIYKRKMKNKEPQPQLKKWSAHATSTTNTQWHRNGGRRPLKNRKKQTKY